MVVGAGPNGLVAACMLARAGRRVLVLEGQSVPGGACRTETLTRPGFHHDVGAGFIAFQDAEAFRVLDLARHGLRFLNGTWESVHPAPDGSSVAVGRDVEATAAAFGDDGDAWRTLASHHGQVHDALIQMMGPIGTALPVLKLGPLHWLRLLRIFTASSGGLGERLFRTEAARRVFPAMGMHVDIGPDDRFGAGIGYMLAMAASQTGFAVPEGGVGRITDALVAELYAHGGELRTGTQVVKFRCEDRVRAAVLADGTEVEARAILADVAPQHLFLEMLEDAQVASWLKRRMRVFPMGWGTFKVDWALSGPVPWTSREARASATVHAGDSIDDLRRFTGQVRSGQPADNPYLVIGQQSLVDRQRVEGDGETLYAYTKAPARPTGGWDPEAYADVMEQRIEGLAPGFRALVLDRCIRTPLDLQARVSPNVVDGDFGGGSNQWYRQLIFRPVFPYFRYRTPVRGLYLCSSFTHPGTGVHGMCGYNAANRVLADRVLE